MGKIALWNSPAHCKWLFLCSICQHYEISCFIWSLEIGACNAITVPSRVCLSMCRVSGPCDVIASFSFSLGQWSWWHICCSIAAWHWRHSLFSCEIYPSALESMLILKSKRVSWTTSYQFRWSHRFHFNLINPIHFWLLLNVVSQSYHLVDLI